MQYCSYSIGSCFYHQSHPQLGIVFALAPSLHSFWIYFSTDLQKHIGCLMTWGVPLLVSYHFAFSYCSWCSQCKNTEVACHSLLQRATFCQNSPPGPSCLWWPYRAWLSFVELDKAVVHVIRLASFLCLWFQSVCPLMPSFCTYHLTWVSCPLDMGYISTPAPAMHSLCPLPWTCGISSRPLLRTLVLGYFLSAAPEP